jgi:crotonobetainyl-CoA:carnitine CoA-transferase CaiB-like acyl-CoA transferase
MTGPLEGLKVLDFTTLLPGPYATMTLADLGADVLKIVSGSRPDLVSFMPPFVPGTTTSSVFVYLCRGKRCMTLNLKDPRALKIIHKLIAEHDIVIEQFRPGVMAKLGLDYERLKKINPGLIYCSLTGYGQTGPMRDRAGHDINYLARSGLMAYSGKKETGPALMGMQIADVASGSSNAMLGILAAVIYRNKTGKGQYIDISMTDGVVAFHAMMGAAYLAGGAELTRESDVLNGGSLYDFYEAKDGRYISFGGLEPQFFTAFCQAIGRDDLIAGTVGPPNVDKVKQEVREIIKSKTRDEWVKIFAQVDACVEPVLSLSEALADAHVKERNLIVELHIPGGGKLRQIACPIKFSVTPPAYESAGTAPGAHTKEVLLDLGYSESEIEEFEKTGLFN